MWTWILTGAVIFVVIVALAVALSRNGRSARGTTPGLALHEVPIDPARLSDIYASLGADRKILAIKQLREATGLGLADAKKLTEAIAAGHQPPTTGRPAFPRDSYPTDSVSMARSDGNLSQRARVLRNQGQLMDAIHLVSAETGMGTAEAEKFVQALD